MINDDYLAPEEVCDPFPRYQRLRREDPVHWNPLFQEWEVTRYDDVVWVLRHPECFSSERLVPEPFPYPPPSPEDLAFLQTDAARTFLDRAPAFVMLDGPAHSARRGILHAYFAPKAMASWRPLVRSVIGELLDAAEAEGRMDVMTDLAMPLPYFVIARMLDIPREDLPRLRELAELWMARSGTEEHRLRIAIEAVQGWEAYLADLIEARAKFPGDDLVSLMLQGERDGALTRDDVISTAFLLFVAGHETTMYMIGNGALALVRHPEQWELLCRDPEGLAAPATEECLRYDGPVYRFFRLATQDLELGGKQIRKHQYVRWVIPSANRDETAFPDPDRFDITRNPNRHLAFGSGVHFCLGQVLARIEGQEVFKALAQRLPGLQLAADRVEYVPDVINRAIRALPVVWS